MELEVLRHERILAPVQLVWEEMDSLVRILAKSPQISEYAVAPDGQTARGRTKLAWGPVKWSVEVAVEILELQPRQRIAFAIHSTAIEGRFQGSIDLVSVGEAETKLEYRGRIEVGHRTAGRMRGMFSEIAEDQAHSLVQRVKVKAEQHRMAQERLLK